MLVILKMVIGFLDDTSTYHEYHANLLESVEKVRAYTRDPWRKEKIRGN